MKYALQWNPWSQRCVTMQSLPQSDFCSSKSLGMSVSFILTDQPLTVPSAKFVRPSDWFVDWAHQLPDWLRHPTFCVHLHQQPYISILSFFKFLANLELQLHPFHLKNTKVVFHLLSLILHCVDSQYAYLARNAGERNTDLQMLL